MIVLVFLVQIGLTSQNLLRPAKKEVHVKSSNNESGSKGSPKNGNAPMKAV